MFTLETSDVIEDLVVGTTIFGTGGGGSPQTGRTLLESDLKAGLKLRVASLKEISDDALIVSPYSVASVAPNAQSNKKVTILDPFSVGLKLMERHFKRKVAATVATELGGGNTAAALHVAAQLGIPIIDGDLLGRAGPELHQSTTHIFDVAMSPSAIVSETGNVVFIEQYADIDDYEALARYVSILAGAHAAVIDTPLTKAEAMKIVIGGTISKSLAVGRTVRESKQNGLDPVEGVRKALGGWIIFRGAVDKYEWKNEKGFLIGNANLTGTGDFRGQSFRSWIKNEHILAWLDSKPIVMPPDLIIFLDEKGYPVTNSALKLGLEVSVLAAKAPEVWRSQRGLRFFGPRRFGFDYEYAPVESLVK
jgi:DUF917 family protein